MDMEYLRRINYLDSVLQWTSKDGRSLLDMSWDEMKWEEATDPSLRRHWTKSRRQRRAGILNILRNPPSDVELREEFNGTGVLVVRHESKSRRRPIGIVVRP